MITQLESYNIAKEHGFEDYNDNPLYVPTKLALIMSECVEALDAHRKGMDGALGSELADIVLRTMNLAEALGIDLNREIDIKHHVNTKRPYKHAGRRY